MFEKLQPLILDLSSCSVTYFGMEKLWALTALARPQRLQCYFGVEKLWTLTRRRRDGPIKALPDRLRPYKSI
jgi:hypothetical protein